MELKIRIPLVVAFLALIIPISSCADSSYNYECSQITPEYPYSYITFTKQEGILRFSFEYPDFFKEELQEARSSLDRVAFSRSIINNYLDSIIEIQIRYGSEYVDAKTAADQNITKRQDFYNGIKKSGKDNGRYAFEYGLIQRSSIDILDTIGEYIISYEFWDENRDPEPEASVYDPTYPTIIRELYFNVKNCLVKIALISTCPVEKYDETFWNHIIETFKILD